MSFRRALLPLIAVSAIAFAVPAKSASPEGLWLVEDQTGRIRIEKCGNEMWGFLAWQKEARNDTNNPNLRTVRDRLMDEATRIIKGKIARHEKLLGIKLQPPAQVYVERYAVHYPTQMYDSYQAYESEEFRPERQKYTVQAARKSRTFYFNGLDGDGFDTVVNPVITQPVIQYTLYLKVKYEVEQPKPK